MSVSSTKTAEKESSLAESQSILSFLRGARGFLSQPADGHAWSIHKVHPVTLDERKSLPSFADYVLLNDFQRILIRFCDDGDVAKLCIGKHHQIVRLRFLRCPIFVLHKSAS